MTIATKDQLSGKKNSVKYNLQLSGKQNDKPLKDLFYKYISGLKDALTTASNKHTKLVLDDVKNGKANFHSPESMFSDIAGAWTGVLSNSDAALLKPLYAKDEKRMKDFSGCKNADEFASKFERCREQVFRLFYKYGDILGDASFPGTYYHKDITGLFVEQATKVAESVDKNKKKYVKHGMFNKEHAAKRVSATASIILRIAYGNINAGSRVLYGRRSLLSMLQLSAMHHGQQVIEYKDDKMPRYNSSSVAFTLLTFSYFMAIGIERDKEEKKHLNDWYFFWRVFGSCLGLVDSLLPQNHEEAASLFKAYTDSGELLCPQSLRMLEKNLKTLNLQEDRLLNKTAYDLITYKGIGSPEIDLKSLIFVYNQGVAVSQWTLAKWVTALYRSQGWKETSIVDGVKGALAAAAIYGSYHVLSMIIRNTDLFDPTSK